MGCGGGSQGLAPDAQPGDAGQPDVPDDTGTVDGTLDSGTDTAADTATDVPADTGGDGPCPEGMAMVPAGSMLFGLYDKEVSVATPYCVDIFEVTAGQFNVCVAAGACEGYEGWEMCQVLDEATSPNQCFEDRDDFAANWINWFRADDYCAFVGKRLPTTEEWEKATRGEKGDTYPWGEDPLTCDRAHQGRGQIFDACLGFGGLPDRPVEVGSYPAGLSSYGLFDTLGNVKEWVDHREDTTTRPGAGDKGLTRGADFQEGDWLVTATASNSLLAVSLAGQGHGFRCAKDAQTAR